MGDLPTPTPRETALTATQQEGPFGVVLGTEALEDRNRSIDRRCRRVLVPDLAAREPHEHPGRRDRADGYAAHHDIPTLTCAAA